MALIRVLTWLCALCVALAAGGTVARADVLEGRIVGVRDGDTVDLLTARNERVRVRLAAIDAPELGQPYGRRAKEALSTLTFDRIVRVEWTKKDSYGRIVGKLLVHRTDVNLSLVQRGLAWHYKAYANEQSPGDRRRYAAAEAAARAQRLGLWRDPNPVAPWLYRHRGGVRSAAASTGFGRKLAARQIRASLGEVG